MSWKDVRKNVKDSDDKGGADADAIDLEDVRPPEPFEWIADKVPEREPSRSWIWTDTEDKLKQEGQAYVALGSIFILLRTSA